MTSEQADRAVALLELIALKLGASPSQVRAAGRPKAEPAAPTPEGSSVSVVRPGRGGRLVPQQGHPHERFDGDYPTSTVRSKADFWKRRD